MSFYKNYLSKLLFKFEAERIHNFSLGALSLLEKLALLNLLELKEQKYNRDSRLEKKLFGLNFPNQIGLAAGLDKNGEALLAWQKLGFGFLEIGTITSQEQPGNPLPRLFRLVKQESILNRMGFNNSGAKKICLKLAAKKKKLKIPLGINLGKSKIVSVKDPARVIKDYLESLELMEAVADYFSINVSSPNTPGLREIQFKFLPELLEEIRKKTGKPILLKISPDLTFQELEKILETTENSKINGIIATNTTTSRDFKELPDEFKNQAGGISGRLLAQKSLEITKWLLKNKSKDLVLVNSGGIFSAKEAQSRLELGVDLIQIYTGLVFNGPSFVKAINQEILYTFGQKIKDKR